MKKKEFVYSTPAEFIGGIKYILNDRGGRCYVAPYQYEETKDTRAEVMAAAARKAYEREKADRAAINSSWGNVPGTDTGAALYANGERLEGK